MSKPLPKRDLKWKQIMPTKKEILNKKQNAENGWILEVDLEYPAEQHEQHNSYPLAPEKNRMYVGLAKEVDERPGAETPGQHDDAADT